MDVNNIIVRINTFCFDGGQRKIHPFFFKFNELNDVDIHHDTIIIYTKDQVIYIYRDYGSKSGCGNYLLEMDFDNLASKLSHNLPHTIIFGER